MTSFAIDGLDLDDARRRIEGDDLLVELLLAFAERWATGASRIAAAARSGRVSEAARIAHALSGVASTLGLVAIGRSARELEELLVTGVPVDDLASRIEMLETSLSRCATSIAALRPPTASS